MKLTRQYDPNTITPEARQAGVQPRVTHVTVHNTGFTANQNFDDGTIDAGLRDGWATLESDRLLIKTDGEPLRYTVKRLPGYFCKSTGEPIPITAKAWAKFRYGNDSSLSQLEARMWLAAHGKGPLDYDIAVAYHCVLDADQHERLRAVPGPKNTLVAAHTTLEA